MGDRRIARYLKYFFAFHHVCQKMGRCLNVELSECIFCSYSWNSVPELNRCKIPFASPKAMQLIVHHASYTSLTSKYIEVHLCLKSLILLSVYFSLEISVRVQRIYARKIVFQCSTRCGALSWAFFKPTAFSLELRLSRWWQRVSTLHKWFRSPHHRESAPCSSRRRLLQCMPRYIHPAGEPEPPAKRKGKEPNLQQEARDALGVEELSRDSKDLTSKAA